MKKILQFLIFTISFSVVAQTLGSKLDKKKLGLGEVGKMTINISSLQGKPVESAPKNELLPFHFEEVNDSINLSKDFYERTIEFAVFEEGVFTIPPLDFKIGGELYHTIPYTVEVGPINNNDELNDIMSNKELKLGLRDYWELYKWYILGALLVIAVIFMIFVWVKYGRKKKSSPVTMTNQTLKELDALKKKKYHEKGEFRSFYVELIDITRNFITRQYKIPADVLLTDDLISLMKKTNSISPENETVIEEIFLRGDLVKFAKIFPDQSMMENDFQNIRNMVKRSSRDLELENLRNGV